MDISTILAALAALLAGAGLGWFFGSRPVKEWQARHATRDGEAKELDGRK
jgi:DNA recombination protein RmuC